MHRILSLYSHIRLSLASCDFPSITKSEQVCYRVRSGLSIQNFALIGGTAAFASAAMLGPRLGRYADGIDPLPLGNPVNACMGLFVLWWGWLAFNSGSTYGVSGAKWQYAARAAVMTMMGSFGGGCFSVV